MLLSKRVRGARLSTFERVAFFYNFGCLVILGVETPCRWRAVNLVFIQMTLQDTLPTELYFESSRCDRSASGYLKRMERMQVLKVGRGSESLPRTPTS